MRLQNVVQNRYTVGHTEIHAWGNRNQTSDLRIRCNGRRTKNPPDLSVGSVKSDVSMLYLFQYTVQLTKVMLINDKHERSGGAHPAML